MSKEDSTRRDMNRIAYIYHDRLDVSTTKSVAELILYQIEKQLQLNLPKCLNSIPNPILLDLCCGKGAVALALKKNGLENATIFGLDIFEYSEKYLSLESEEDPYKERIIGDITEPNTLEQIKKSNPNGFNLITCFRLPPTIFEFILENFNLFTDLLKPGGYMVLTNEIPSESSKKISELEKENVRVIETILPVASTLVVYQKPEEKN